MKKNAWNIRSLVDESFSISYCRLSDFLKTDRKWMSLYKWPLYNLFWPFFAICMFIFHKIEVLTVILRCLTGLTYDWVKSYDPKWKYFHFFFCCDFVQKQRFSSLEFFSFLYFLSKLLYQIRFRLLKHLKMTIWISVLWKINTWLAKNGQIWSKNDYYSVAIFWEFAELAQGLRLHLRP